MAELENKIQDEIIQASKIQIREYAIKITQ